MSVSIEQACLGREEGRLTKKRRSVSTQPGASWWTQPTEMSRSSTNHREGGRLCCGLPGDLPRQQQQQQHQQHQQQQQRRRRQQHEQRPESPVPLGGRLLRAPASIPRGLVHVMHVLVAPVVSPPATSSALLVAIPAKTKKNATKRRVHIL